KDLLKKCDALSKDLLENGYPSFSLRDYDSVKTVKSIISDFINKESSSLLIATSDASTDLDLKDLQLVINYDLPSDFGHLCCRFGLFGTCCAVTFISSGNDADARYAMFLVDALERCIKPVPDDLKTIADEFNAAINKMFDLPSDYDYDDATFAKTFRL
ncbi:DEAD-box ATP-dependent RNA helicase 42, partial [Tanacetum coccineum]